MTAFAATEIARHRQVDRCRCCDSGDLALYLDLGLQPLANSYHKGEGSPRAPLEVMLCRHCFHSQLSVVVDRDTMYRHYLYCSGTTATFRAHCRELAADARRRLDGARAMHVLDIACNDGTLLECFRDLGCEVVGVDPAENLRELTRAKGIDVHVDYWGSECARRLPGWADVITATNVFAHHDDAADFLAACRAALSPRGFIVIEFPYGARTIDDGQLGQQYHEHLSTFLVSSFVTLAGRSGLTVFDMLETPIHGGSIRFFLRPGAGPHAPVVLDAIERERVQALLGEETYHRYGQRLEAKGSRLRELLAELRDDGFKVIGYGAAAKTTVDMCYWRFTVEYVVDDNPLKHGYLMPGTDIPIVATDTLAADPARLAILIFAYNFKAEVVSRIKAARPGRADDRYILHVPDVHLES